MNPAPQGRARARAGSHAAADFMNLLRDDHAGLSRVLREIDAQQSALGSTPEAARAVLAEAVRYLLVFQHSIHHPREDLLFARIREREPGLYRNMRRLVREHRVGQERAEALAWALSRATADQLRGKLGVRLSRQLKDYVEKTRAHMRREEAVFYSGSERVLRPSDWAALMAGPMARDPAGDLHRLAARYPRLAASLARPERTVTGSREQDSQSHDRQGIRRRTERVAELFGEALHDAADLARLGLADLRQVRSPLGLARASVEMGARGVGYAAKLAALPFRR